MAQRTNSMQETLVSAFDYHMSDIYTAIPGVVVSVENMGQQRLSVQPSVNLRSLDGAVETQRPSILDVPFQLPVTERGGLTFPISVGDVVFLMFSMRGMDVWKSGDGSPHLPDDVRQFDARDCVAIPGAYPFSRSPNQGSKRRHSHSPEDVVLVHNIGRGAEVEIRLKPNGDVFINSPTHVEVNCPDVEVNATLTTINSETIINGDTTVNGLFTYTQGLRGSTGSGASAIIEGGINFIGNELTHNGKNIGDTHVHSDVESGSSNTGTPV